MADKLRVELGPGTITYVKEGQGDPVLLLHGIPTSSYLWRNVVPLLAARFAVYAPDLLSYGDSDKPEKADLSVAAQAGYMLEFMEALGIDKAVIVGHDIGGGVAQIMAAREPARVRKMVLIDSVAYDSWPVPDIARLKDPVWDAIMETLDMSRGIRKGLERGIYHKERVTGELVANYVRPFGDLEGRRAYLRCARALDSRDLLDMADQIESVPVPTLVLWAEGDEYQPQRYGELLRDRLRDARLVVLPEAGHFIQEDQPEELARLITEFAQAAHG